MLSSVAAVAVLIPSGPASAGTTSFDPGVDYETRNSPVSVVVHDFNGDGDPDVATAGSTVTVNLGGPGGSFGPAAHYEGGFDLRSLAIGDFDADGNPDLVAADERTDTVSVLLGSPDGTFGDATSFPVDVTPTSVAVGDFDGDDDPDLAVSSVVNDTVSILLGGAGGTFGPKTSIQAGYSSPLSVAVGDFNGDADPDLAVGDVGGNIHVLLGGPAATFDPAAVYSTGTLHDVDSMKIALGDFNGDSDHDMVVVDKDRGLWTLLGTSGGSFTEPRGYVVPAATDVAVGDFNDDSRADLGISEDAGRLEVLHGRGDGTFVDLTQFPTNRTSTAVAAGDFDADGRTDVALTKPQGGGLPAGIAVMLNPRDTTAPNTTITGGPSGPTKQDRPTFTFSSSEPGSTFRCRRDVDEAFQACTSPWQLPTGVDDGPHTFEVRATDRSGNVDPTAASRDYEVDTVPPIAFFTAGPTGRTSDATPTFAFSADEPGATFQCQVDGAPFATCESPFTTAELPDGEHTVRVLATDPAGNSTLGFADARTFTVDTVAPDTSVTGGPEAVSTDTTPTFTFTSPEPDPSFECTYDGGNFSPCSSPYTPTAVGDGTFTFKVRAKDAAGNVDPTPATWTFTVDRSTPGTAITTPPFLVTADNTPTFEFTSTKSGSTFECRLDDGVVGACTSPHTIAQLDDGRHSFEVRAKDSIGNVDPEWRLRVFTVDTIAPDTTITSGPSDTVHDGTPTFAISSSEAGATLECRIDAAPFGPCESPHTTPALGDGSHTFQVRATDAAGNTDPTPASRTFTVSLDTTAPQTTITSQPLLLSLSSRASFAFTSSEGGSSFQCRLDAGGWRPCQSPQVYTRVPIGQHTFAVCAIDPAGNTDPTPAEHRWLTLGLLPF